MTPNTERFEIRIKEPTALTRRYGRIGPLYIVWDTETDRQLPFSGYSDRRRAEARVAKEVRALADSKNAGT